MLKGLIRLAICVFLHCDTKLLSIQQIEFLTQQKTMQTFLWSYTYGLHIFI